MKQILQEPVQLQAASRTDRGVHAFGQVVTVFSSKPLNRLSINRLLPKSLVVLSIEKVPFCFHPSLDAVEKEYHYSICYGEYQMPHDRAFSWHNPSKQLNINAMRQFASHWVGTHDFSAFCLNRKKKEVGSCVRTIKRIHFEQIGTNRLRIEVTGDSFFYKMVRALVGTLVMIGKEKIHSNPIQKVDRRAAGVTAPAHGLSLVKVTYNVDGERLLNASMR